MAKITINTDGGSNPNPGPSGGGVFIEIGRTEKIRKCLSFGKETNNRAEMLAMINALEFACTREPNDTIRIFTDSNNVIYAINSTNDDRKNIDLIKDMRQLYLTAKRTVKTLTINKVKAHSGDPANDEADALATLGIKATINDLIGESAYSEDLKTGLITHVEGTLPNATLAVQPEIIEKKAKVKVPKIPPFHPLVSGSKVYYRTNVDYEGLTDGMQIFNSVTFSKGKKDDDNLNNKLGKLAPDSHYSTLLTNFDSEVMRKFTKSYDKMSLGYRWPVVFEMDRIKSSKVWASLHEDFDEVVDVRKHRMFDDSGALLAERLDPPKMVHLAEQRFDFCLNKIHQFLEKDERLTITDITDRFLVKNEKGKVSVNPDFTLATRDIQIKKGLKLGVRLDVPHRSTFSNLIKTHKDEEISVHMVEWSRDDYGCCYGCVVQVGKDIAFTYSHVASYRLKI